MAKKSTLVEALDISALAMKMEANREERRKLALIVTPLEAEYKELKAAVMKKFDAEGSIKWGNEQVTMAITETTVPVVDDIDALITHLKRTKNMHVFLTQPMSTPSWRELVERKGGDLPGTHTFVKRDISHTSLKTKS